MTRLSVSLIALAGVAPVCLAQSQIIDVQYNTTTLDRWNYPFNGSPGSRLSASTFGAVLLEGFDDHDAQFVIGFDTDADVPAGLEAGQYRVLSATVTITNSNGGVFRYDPTYDTFDTYRFLDDSLDTDPGRPVHLWAVGYRNGFDQSSWGEYTTFGGPPSVEPVQESRNAFGVYFPDALSAPVEISNNLKQWFDPTPMAIAQTDAVAPGQLVPADTEFSFEVDLCQPGIKNYLAQGLSLGEARFAVSSLHAANGGKGGGTGDVLYPFWYTRENPVAVLLGLTPTLHLRVRVGSVGDYNGDGVFNFFDVSAFLSDFTSGNLDADLNGDCTLNFFDVSMFLTAFGAG